MAQRRDNEQHYESMTVTMNALPRWKTKKLLERKETSIEPCDPGLELHF
jgi:hypothetical protein